MPGFVAKTQNPLFLVLVFCMTLKDFVDGDRGKMVFCPVRALKKYLSRIEQYYPNCSNLSMSTGNRKKKINKNTISFLVKGHQSVRCTGQLLLVTTHLQKPEHMKSKVSVLLCY